jgi:hypothetical protein
VLRTIHGIDQTTLYLKYQYERHGRSGIDHGSATTVVALGL